MYSSNQNPLAHLVTSSKQAPYLVHFFTYKIVLLLTSNENPFFPLTSSFCVLIKKPHFFHLQAHSVSISNQNPFWPIFSLTSSFCEHIKPKPILAHFFTYKLILWAHQTKTHSCPSFHLQAHSVSTSNQNPFFHLHHSVLRSDQNPFFYLQLIPWVHETKHNFSQLFQYVLSGSEEQSAEKLWSLNWSSEFHQEQITKSKISSVVGCF